jgi:hypothetical protein
MQFDSPVEKFVIKEGSGETCPVGATVYSLCEKLRKLIPSSLCDLVGQHQNR